MAKFKVTRYLRPDWLMIWLDFFSLLYTGKFADIFNHYIPGKTQNTGRYISYTPLFDRSLCIVVLLWCLRGFIYCKYAISSIKINKIIIFIYNIYAMLKMDSSKSYVYFRNSCKKIKIALFEVTHMLLEPATVKDI